MKNLIFEAFTKAKQEWRKSGVRSAQPLLEVTSMVILLLMVSVNVWGNYTPGSGYTKVTNISQLSAQYDQVILYEEATGMGVTGSDGTDATLSSTQDAWTIYTVMAISGSTFTLADYASTINPPYIAAVSESTHYNFTYNTSSGTYFSVSSGGLLQYDSKHLAHNGNNVRFYSSSGTPLYVYKLNTPDPQTPASSDGLYLSPATIYMSGKSEDTYFYSSFIKWETTYNSKSHQLWIEPSADNWATGMELEFYQDDYGYSFNGNFTSGSYASPSNPEYGGFNLRCKPSEPGTFEAELVYTAYSSYPYPELRIPIVITVTADCTPRTLSFTNGTTDKTIYWTGSKTYTNAATASAGTGTIAYDIVADPDGCASVNSSGVVTFTSMGTAIVAANILAVGDYCAADANYTITMTCEPRTLSFTTAEPEVSITSGEGTYSQAPTVSAGSGHGTITYTIDSDDGLTIDPSTGVVSFNGNAGTAMVTATISAADGYCTANNSYFLTVTPVVPTVSAFTPSATETSITMTGSEVTNKGGSAITRYGYIYSTTLSTAGTLIYGAVGATDAYVGTNDIALNTGFNKTVTGLSSGTTYYVRAYATNAAGTGYSDIQTIKTVTYEDYVFSCAELTLTAHPETESGPIFITSTASKKVRSQGYIQITGSGLTPSTTLTFPSLPATFEIKTATYGDLATDVYGAIDAAAYIFYTPGAAATSDGLDKITGITVTVGGAKTKTATLTQDIIGRHLPANFVIAGKKDNKWYALPSNMESTSHPAPVEIAVDNLNNPSIAYTVASNKYGLEGPTTTVSGNIKSGVGQYVKLTMHPLSDAPLFGQAPSNTGIGKSGTAVATNDLSAGYWWQLKQTNTSISNPQDVKYKIYCANNTSTLSIKDNAGNPEWGLYASGVEELRLIPASDIIYTEAYFVEWGQHGGVVEVDATGIDATSVVAHLNGANSSAITLVQTGTSGGKSSKYNYTVNFGDGIDFAASTSNGAMLTLEWKNGETVKAISNIVVPKIIASSATMKFIMSGDAQWETEVHVLPDVTLTANAGDFESNDVMIKQLEIYPGATVVVTEGEAGSGTLKVKTLVLRNGWTCASGTRKYDVARLYITPSTASLAKNAVVDVWYMDWYIDYDQYYPIAVPWKVAVNSSNIVHRYTSNTATFGPSGSIRLRYYDGEQRATSGQSMIGQNWKDYGNENLPDYLEPSKGYSFSAKRPSGKAFSIVRMTLGIPSNDWTALGEQGEVSGTHKDQVSVTGWGKGTADWYAMGWNFIGNPYMCTFNGNDDGISGKLELQNGGSIKYATIPSIDFSNYDQVAIADADLKPARGFFIQANNAEAQNITFNANKIVDPTAAPARYMTQTEAIPEQEAYIRLSYEGGKDQMGLIIGEDYTEAYEVNADLAKVLGDAGFVKTYMQYGGMDMAYVAINQELAKAWIPVTVILPKDGEYTFSLMSSSEVEQLEGVYLIDYAENETVTNLIDKDYTFVADAATISNRFAINAIIGERQTPTDIDVINEGGDLNSDRPFKFIYHDKVYIYHRGVIYDATGKRVREINK